MRRLKAVLHFVGTLGIGLLASWTVFGQEAAGPAAAHDHTVIDPSLLDFIKVFGFGAMIFLIWWGDYRKIGKLTRLVENYEGLTREYHAMAKETRDTMLLTMQVNTRLVERLDYVLESRGSGPTSSAGKGA